MATGSKTKQSWNLEFGAFKIMTSGFYCTNLKQINSRKLSNLLFKHISPINDQQITIIIPICVPMISLWLGEKRGLVHWGKVIKWLLLFDRLAMRRLVEVSIRVKHFISSENHGIKHFPMILEVNMLIHRWKIDTNICTELMAFSSNL